MGIYQLTTYKGEPGKWFDLDLKSSDIRGLRDSCALGVLTMLKADSDENGRVEISTHELAELVGCAWRTAFDGVLLLEREGYLTVIKRDYLSLDRNIPASVKWAIFKRDKYTCRYCGKTDGPFVLDHVDPFFHGGETSMDNLVTACPSCNRTKSDRTPEQANMPLREIQ